MVKDFLFYWDNFVYSFQCVLLIFFLSNSNRHQKIIAIVQLFIIFIVIILLIEFIDMIFL